MSNFNIDWMKFQNNNAIAAFYEIMSHYFFAHFILQPARITSQSTSVTDNIFFNGPELRTRSGIFPFQIFRPFNTVYN